MSWGGQQYAGYGQGTFSQGSGQGQLPQGQHGAQSYGAPGGQRPGLDSAQGYGSPQFQGSGYGTAPQHGYGGSPQQGYGVPPQQGYGAAQSHQAYGSRFSGPPGAYGGSAYSSVPPGVDPELWTWFQTVDTDSSGKISATELQQALMNGNWSPFNTETCRLMIGMFDKDRNGSIDIHEFAALWKYIQDWKACFDRFDTDRSGNIDANELGSAFQTFGYRLSQQFNQLVIRVFDRERGGYSINFDDFIQACVMLKTLTDQFRAKDVSQVGQIAISYEEFLEMVLDTTLKK
uniref:Peflin n=1 Tax=Arion vulgaris TaxID=1028688 RepID=A0A0B6ZMU8_9EUPU